MKKVVFRFDIDTHKCIRDGVPNLLKIGEKYQVGFSFFLNVGKSISFINAAKDVITRNEKPMDVYMMSAKEKLGMIDYLEAALLNPNLILYKESIRKLYNSCSEMGIHGGRNHMTWQKYADTWGRVKLEDEIDWALKMIKKVVPAYVPKGFASPGWTSVPQLDEILAKKGFLYCADYRCKGSKNVVKKGKYLPYLGVNLLGEPGGVAFFEYCRVQGYSSKQIVKIVMDNIERNEVTVLYDHPYYAGIKELKCISKIIELVQEKENIEIVTLEKML